MASRSKLSDNEARKEHFENLAEFSFLFVCPWLETINDFYIGVGSLPFVNFLFIVPNISIKKQQIELRLIPVLSK
jgi:hypothetical protein